MGDVENGSEAGRIPRPGCGPWVFCRKCRRAFLREEWLPIETDVRWNSLYHPRECPYPGCDGLLARDAIRWRVVHNFHPEFPHEPERGVVYDVRIIAEY